FWNFFRCVFERLTRSGDATIRVFQLSGYAVRPNERLTSPNDFLFTIPGASQFSDGFCALSMTRTSTGPLADSSFIPSCSCKAVLREGAASAGSGAGGLAAESGVHSRVALNDSVYSVCSVRVGISRNESAFTRSFIVIPWPINFHPTPDLKSE